MLLLKTTHYRAIPIACLLAGILCLQSLHTYAESLRVVDSVGRDVVLHKAARRIVALAPHIVENTFSAGCGSKLVGAVSYSDYPPEAKTLPLVGSYDAYSLEKIVSLQPDLVLAWSAGDGKQVAKPFESLGIPVYVDDPRKLNEVATSVRNIGQLCGTATDANAAEAQYTERMSALRQRYSQSPPVTVFYEVWNSPLQTVNDKHIISAVIRLCGGRNIFVDTPVIAPKVSMESVLSRNPDVIIASGMDVERPEWLDEWRDYPQLSAVVNENLYHIPPTILQRHTFRILQGAEQMCASLQQARNKRAYTVSSRRR